MGPRYSSDGATQALIGQKVKKIVLVQSNVPGTDYIEEGPRLITEDAGLPFEGLKENVPIQDANSAALKAVQAAGDDGGVVLNFTPPEALKILQAAQQQGLQDRVKWGCSTPCNTDFLAEALGDAWDGKLFVNAELNLIDGRRARQQPLPRGAEAVRAGHPARELQPDGLHRGAHRHRGAARRRGRLHQGVRQRGVQGRQELQDGHPVRAVVLRRGAAAPPEQRRPHRHAEGRR